MNGTALRPSASDPINRSAGKKPQSRQKEWTMGTKFRVLTMSALLVCSASLTYATTPVDGAKVGHWKTWVLASGSEIAVPAPPADTSDQTKKELDELRQLQTQRDAISNTAVQFYNAVPASQRWHE